MLYCLVLDVIWCSFGRLARMFWRECAACIFSLVQVSCMSESGSDIGNGTGVVGEPIGPELGMWENK